MTKLLATVAFFAFATAAQAQTVAELCKDGAVAVIRVSKITSTMAAFEEAVKAQAAWYQSHGFKDDKIVLASVIAEGKPNAISKTEMMTIHYNPASSHAEVTKDEAWAAFVAKFRASSEIVSEHTACLPK